MHIYRLCPSFITTKFHEILLSCFRGVALTTVSVVSFILVKFLSSKRAKFREKKIESEIPVDMHMKKIKSFITTKFQEILLSGFRGIALTNCFL